MYYDTAGVVELPWRDLALISFLKPLSPFAGAFLGYSWFF